MNYAPVIIPTLNRVEHLRRCLQSLEKNYGAENTDVYISVDYPPSDKYWDGYLEVKAWLEENASKLKFKNTKVFFQTENLGARENSFFLERQVQLKSDRYIYTEDDNEFAPNFLEYINKGLDVFEENENVIGICGTKDTQWKFDSKSITYAKLFPAYGYGSWFSKESEIKKRGQNFLLDKTTLSFSKMLSLLKRNRCLFTTYICEVLCKDTGLYWYEDNLYWCDSLRSIYMHLSDIVCVVPEKPKSRTWGNDGTGINMAALDINPEDIWPLDTESRFEYEEIEEICYIPDNYKIGSDYLKPITGIKGTIKGIVFYVLLLLNKGERKKVIEFINKYEIQ